MANDDATLQEPTPVPEILIHSADVQCDGNVCRVTGWTRVPAKFPDDRSGAPQRVVVLRYIMPIERYREYIAQAARMLGMME